MLIKIEEKIEELKELLNAGEIDENTYNEEVERIKRKAVNGEIEEKNIFEILRSISIVLVVIIILASVVFIFQKDKLIKEVKYVKSLKNLQRPIQTPIKKPVEKKTINGIDTEITYVAQYNINGRVIRERSYFGSSVQDKLSPKDLGLGWGFVARDQNYKKISWSNARERQLQFYVSDGFWLKEVGGINSILENCSNNHLVPSDNKTRKLINLIKEGDYINIEGYLIDINILGKNGSSYLWKTSTVRSDSKNGACETLYVTNVKWLKEESSNNKK